MWSDKQKKLMFEKNANLTDESKDTGESMLNTSTRSGAVNVKCMFEFSYGGIAHFRRRKTKVQIWLLERFFERNKSWKRVHEATGQNLCLFQQQHFWDFPRKIKNACLTFSFSDQWICYTSFLRTHFSLKPEKNVCHLFNYCPSSATHTSTRCAES